MKTVASIVPTLIGLMMAVGILRTSGFLDMLANMLGDYTDKIGLPAPLLPLLLVRLFSSSAATGLTLDLFEEFGTDSYIGLIASITTSATETVFLQSLFMPLQQRLQKLNGHWQVHLWQHWRELRQAL